MRQAMGVLLGAGMLLAGCMGPSHTEDRPRISVTNVAAPQLEPDPYDEVYRILAGQPSHAIDVEINGSRNTVIWNEIPKSDSRCAIGIRSREGTGVVKLATTCQGPVIAFATDGIVDSAFGKPITSGSLQERVDFIIEAIYQASKKGIFKE